MNKNVVLRAILVSSLGYASVVAFACLIWKGFQILTGYYPSFAFFVLALVTFRLAEVSRLFLLLPPLVAVLTMMGLSEVLDNNMIVSGLGLSSYYIFVALVFLALGAGEFPFEVALLWILMTFFLGTTSGRMVDRLTRQRQGCRSLNGQ